VERAGDTLWITDPTGGKQHLETIQKRVLINRLSPIHPSLPIMTIDEIDGIWLNEVLSPNLNSLVYRLRREGKTS
jgi:hypothetical protein